MSDQRDDLAPSLKVYTVLATLAAVLAWAAGLAGGLLVLGLWGMFVWPFAVKWYLKDQCGRGWDAWVTAIWLLSTGSWC